MQCYLNVVDCFCFCFLFQPKFLRSPLYSIPNNNTNKQTRSLSLCHVLALSLSVIRTHTHTHRERGTRTQSCIQMYLYARTYIHAHANVPSSLFVNHSCKCLKFGNAKPKSLANFCIKAHITAKSGSFAQVCNVVVNASSSLSLHSSLHSAVAEDAAIFHASAEKMC